MADVESVLEHAGVKGMKWGVRNERDAGGGGGSSSSTSLGGSTRALRKEGRERSKEIGGAAKEIISEYRRAPSPAAKRKAASRYEKEVLNQIKSKEFETAFKASTQVTKGQMAAHVLLFGVFAPFTIKAAKNNAREAYDMELDMAHGILDEMRYYSQPRNK